MRQKLFQETSVKLTGVYLGVLMMLSLIFSVALFRVSASQLNRNFSRAIDFANRFGGFQQDPVQQNNYIADRVTELSDGRHHLISQLVVLNIIILGSGGVLCYALARRTLEPIEQSHTALERFTSDASHELRTPLTTMRTEIEVALMNPKLTTKEASALLRSNLEEVGRLSLLSERLLTLARLGEESLPKRPVAAYDLVKASIDAAEPSARAKDISIKNLLFKKSRISTLGDATSLTEAIVILLDNAVKYSSSGTTVTVNAIEQHKNLLISVTDQGIGIAAEDVKRVFERFYRADHSRTGSAQHGYGLGLALASKIVAMHAGKINVASVPGKGCIFTIVLPLA